MFGVIAALVKTTHTLESFDEGRGVGRDGPLNTQEADTSTSRARVKDRVRVDPAVVALKPQGRDVRVAGHREVCKVLQVPKGQVGDRSREMQHFDGRAVRQVNTCNAGAVEVDVLEVDTLREVDGLCKVRAVPDIDILQKRKVTDVQLCEVRIRVPGGVRADLEVGQSFAGREVSEADHVTGNVADVEQLGRGVDVSLSVVDIVKRTHESCRHVPLAAGLNEDRTEFDTRVDVRVRRQRDIRLCVATKRDRVRQGVARVELGVEIPKSVVQPPLPLFGLGALQHGEVGRVAVVDQRVDVLELRVFIEDCFRPLLLMSFEERFDCLVGQATSAEVEVHRSDFYREGVSKVVPHDRVLAIINVRPVNGIGILKTVPEDQGAFVVGTVRGIEVVRQPGPLLSLSPVRRERVLRSGVDHEEDQRKQVVEDGVLKVEVVRDFRLELRQSVCSAVGRVGGAVVGDRRRKRFVRGLCPVGGLQPGEQSFQLGRVSVVFRIPGFEVLRPRRDDLLVLVDCGRLEVIGLEEDTVRGVVLDLPGFIAFGEAEYFLGAFVKVPVVLTDEVRRGPVVPEDDHREACDALSDARVVLLRRSLDRAKVVVVHREDRVVGALRGRYVGLEGERRDFDHTVHKGVLDNDSAVCHDEALLELDLVVLDRVVLRRRTLNVDLDAGRGEVERRSGIVDESEFHRLLVALVLRCRRADERAVRQRLREFADYDLTVGVVDVVPVEPVEHQIDVLRLRDPVVDDLLRREVVVIDTDAVDVDSRVGRADDDVRRGRLLEVVRIRVLDDLRHDAVDVDIHETVLRPLLNDECQADVLLLFELDVDLGLLRFEHCGLRSHFETLVVRPAGQDLCIVVHDLPGSQLDLDGLAGASRVILEDLIGNRQDRVACGTKHGVAVLVLLPAIVDELEVREGTCDVVRFACGTVSPRAGVSFVVRPSVSGECQFEAFRLGFDLDVGLGDCNVEDFRVGIAGRDLDLEGTDVCSTNAECLRSTVDRDLLEHLVVDFDHDFRREGVRVVDVVGELQGRVLRAFGGVERAGDDPLVVQSLGAEDLVVKDVRLDRHTVDVCVEVDIERMRAVSLRGDGVRQLTVCNSCLHRSDLTVVNKEPNGLCDGADGREGERNDPGVCHRGVKRRTDGEKLHLNGVSDCSGLSVDVRDGDRDRVTACAEVSRDVQDNVALGDVYEAFDDAPDGDPRSTVAGLEVVFNGRPVDAEPAGVACCDGPGPPAGVVRDGQFGVDGLSAASATAGTGAPDDRTDGVTDDFAGIVGQVDVIGRSVIVAVRNRTVEHQLQEIGLLFQLVDVDALCSQCRGHFVRFLHRLAGDLVRVRRVRDDLVLFRFDRVDGLLVSVCQGCSRCVKISSLILERLRLILEQLDDFFVVVDLVRCGQSPDRAGFDANVNSIAFGRARVSGLYDRVLTGFQL